MHADVCSVVCIHPEKVDRARTRMVSEGTAERLAELFKVLADPTRVRILSALQHGELCVCDLAAAISASQSAVSHQLRLLRVARLVKVRREGKMAFYSLDDDHVRHLFREGLEHVAEE
jgi:DNA-binding transcriptional ArsR family regulator